MYESKYALVIIIPPNISYYEHIALQIAHDWYLYGRGDSVIMTTDEEQDKHDGYKIYLGLKSDHKLIESTLSGIEFVETSFNKVVGIKVGDQLYDEPGTGNNKK
jgi:hypothetical protein